MEEYASELARLIGEVPRRDDERPAFVRLRDMRSQVLLARYPYDSGYAYIAAKDGVNKVVVDTKDWVQGLIGTIDQTCKSLLARRECVYARDQLAAILAFFNHVKLPAFHATTVSIMQSSEEDFEHTEPVGSNPSVSLCLLTPPSESGEEPKTAILSLDGDGMVTIEEESLNDSDTPFHLHFCESNTDSATNSLPPTNSRGS
ncbi:hypothetical protein Pelo_1348 [Pelomyxa schiedti]|nr:hypothetical protein Pelo_1348 [Pelomyxa schiedti]